MSCESCEKCNCDVTNEPTYYLCEVCWERHLEVFDPSHDPLQVIREKLRSDLRADIGTGRDGWFGVRGETIRLILGD